MRLAASSSWLYSSSSHSRCSVFSGSFSCTGMATLDRSFPMLFLRMFHRLTLLQGRGEGSAERRRRLSVPTLLTRGQQERHQKQVLKTTIHTFLISVFFLSSWVSGVGWSLCQQSSGENFSWKIKTQSGCKVLASRMLRHSSG